MGHLEGVRRAAIPGRHDRRHQEPARISVEPGHHHALDCAGVPAARRRQRLPRLRCAGLSRGGLALRHACRSRGPGARRPCRRHPRHPGHHLQPHRVQLGVRRGRDWKRVQAEVHHRPVQEPVPEERLRRCDHGSPAVARQRRLCLAEGSAVHRELHQSRHRKSRRRGLPRPQSRTQAHRFRGTARRGRGARRNPRADDLHLSVPGSP